MRLLDLPDELLVRILPKTLPEGFRKPKDVNSVGQLMLLCKKIKALTTWPAFWRTRWHLQSTHRLPPAASAAAIRGLHVGTLLEPLPQFTALRTLKAGS